MAALRIDRDHHALGAEDLGELADQLRARERRRVDRDLVGSGVEDGLGVGDRPDAAADRERDEDVVGGSPGERDDRVAPLVRGGDVEEDELVCALGVVALGELDRVARVAQADEVGSLDHPPTIDVQARDDAPKCHARASADPSASRPPGAACEGPGLQLLDQAQHLRALVGGQVPARPAARSRDQYGEPRALVAVQQRQVMTDKQRQLGDR